MSELRLYKIPAVHVLQLADTVQQWDVTDEELFADLGTDREELSETGARVSLDELIPLLERARILTGERGLGIHLGFRMRASAHGFLGFAAMTARTLRDALTVAVRYAPTRSNAFALSFREADEMVSVGIEERVDFGPARDTLIFWLAAGLWQMANALTGTTLEGDGEFTFPRPDYIERFEPELPGHFRFDQPANRLMFSAQALDLPLSMADPAAQRLAQEQCERELSSLSRDPHLIAQVRRESIRERGFLTQTEVAKRLHISERTLKRRLAQLDTSFAEILEEERRERALLLLRNLELSIEEIADRLGYTDPANFSRAFRRWTQTTPRNYRRSLSE